MSVPPSPPVPWPPRPTPQPTRVRRLPS